VCGDPGEQSGVITAEEVFELRVRAAAEVDAERGLRYP
jgi:hypothetical protein